MATLKKHWVPVLAPQLFKQEHLGDSFVLETETLAGRGITVNLMNLTSDMKKQNLNVAFRVTGVKEGKAHTRVVGIDMQAGSVKRLVRRGRNKIEASMLIKLKHGQVARIKPLVITKSLAKNTTATAIRHKLDEVVAELTAGLVFETLVTDVVQMKLQRHIRDRLTMIFPIRSVDIRSCHLEPKHALEEEHEAEPSTYEGAPQVAAVDDAADRG